MPRLRPKSPLRSAEGDVPALIGLFTQIADRWKLSIEERTELLGRIGRTTHYEWTREKPPEELSVDQRERIAHIIGIDVATQAFYGFDSPNAATHIRRPGTAPNGEGTALELMLTGIPGLRDVRRHVEALGGGSVVAALHDQHGDPGVR